jgi:hypothetical protein
VRNLSADAALVLDTGWIAANQHGDLPWAHCYETTEIDSGLSDLCGVSQMQHKKRES